MDQADNGASFTAETGNDLLRADPNRQADWLGFVPAESFGKPDESVGHPVLLPKQRKDMFAGFRFDHSSFPVDPRALDSASHVAGGDTNSWIVADALYFSSVGISANE